MTPGLRARSVGWRQLSGAVLAVLLVLGPFVGAADRPQLELPAKLSDSEFWKMIGEFSEPTGFFQSDNLVGNERPLQNVVPALREKKRGGVYLGVAPDQNFTYIVALDPKMAFIVDIRRGNLQAHLMYKALFELSADRAEFLSRLFSRKRPADLTPDTSTEALFQAYWTVDPSEALYKENLKTVIDHLIKTKGFALSGDDVQGIEYVYGMFFRYGPGLTYASSGGSGGRNMPTYADLLQATDLEGRSRSYLATEQNFRALKTFQEKNLLVPVVGDFAGPKALRAVGKYLTDRSATVTAFYTSNVEQYLFRNGVWQAFYDNVATLPIDQSSTFIRSAGGRNVLDPIGAFVKDVRDGKILTYGQVTTRGDIR
jgi:hypothetical protein